jgi:hypothetical protein
MQTVWIRPMHGFGIWRKNRQIDWQLVHFGRARVGARHHPAQENGAEKPLWPSRPQSIPNVDRCAA